MGEGGSHKLEKFPENDGVGKVPSCTHSSQNDTWALGRHTAYIKQSQLFPFHCSNIPCSNALGIPHNPLCTVYGWSDVILQQS